MFFFKGLLLSIILRVVLGLIAPKIWTHAEIDNSNAIEYMAVHHPDQPPLPFNKIKSIETIYDARLGVDSQLVQATLKKHGFCLAVSKTAVRRWHSKKQICQVYTHELQSVLQQHLDGISHIVFWHPNMRATTPSLRQRLLRNWIAGPAASVHVDTDYGGHAHNISALTNWIARNAISECPTDEILDALIKGHRFAVVNAWRSIDRHSPIKRAPLAILHNKKWFAFPSMTADECLLFTQFDRQLGQPSELWHCALPDIVEGSRPRRSFELRAFIVFNEKVKFEEDRFLHAPIPLLSRYNSECFCVAQEERKKAAARI
mmetsp:Transcript_8444/g.11756  ORF Transcript_8444/g.11756 Transcript_8444/m.11756 type:complete len:317 (+) Transcript_8444:106-1056(+)